MRVELGIEREKGTERNRVKKYDRYIGGQESGF